MTTGIPFDLIPMVTAPAVPKNPADESCFWDFFLGHDAYVGCAARKERAAVQDVANRAAYYYGPNSATAQVAQQAADSQAAQAVADQTNIADYYSAGTLIATPGQGMPTWVMAALLVGGLILLRNMNS